MTPQHRLGYCPKGFLTVSSFQELELPNNPFAASFSMKVCHLAFQSSCARPAALGSCYRDTFCFLNTLCTVTFLFLFMWFSCQVFPFVRQKLFSCFKALVTMLTVLWRIPKLLSSFPMEFPELFVYRARRNVWNVPSFSHLPSRLCVWRAGEVDLLICRSSTDPVSPIVPCKELLNTVKLDYC